MNTIKNLATLVVSLAAAAHGFAQTQTFTSKSAFVGVLPPGYDFNNFSSLTAGAGPVASFSFTNGSPAVSYTITAPPGGLFVNTPSGNGIGNYFNTDDLLINFTSGNVHFVGAEFFLSDNNGNRQFGTIALTFSDGTTAVVPSFETGDYGFFGLYSDSVITSLTVANNANFLNIANLYSSASSVPEPASTALVILGGAFFCWLRRGRN